MTDENLNPEKKEPLAENIGEEKSGPGSVDRAEYDRLKEEFERFRQDTERENRQREKRDSLRAALKRAGVEREEMLELLLCAPEAAREDLSAEETAKKLKSRFAACFEPSPLHGVDTVNPPRGGVGTVVDEDSMSDEEYYRYAVGIRTGNPF